jgi:rfaE bifunctional protein nucleotidyltransferase chain/domain
MKILPQRHEGTKDLFIIKPFVLLCVLVSSRLFSQQRQNRNTIGFLVQYTILLSYEGRLEKKMKIFTNVDELNRGLAKLEGKTIVFTNGVFDILHAGHVDLLEFAKSSGDYLIVGINDDDSVRRLKGEDRPVYPLEERIKILAAVMYVDFIIPFSQDTPLELIKGLLRVDVLVKGGDYKPHEVVGRKEVEEGGGKVLLFDFKTDLSTTAILEKIKQT